MKNVIIYTDGACLGNPGRGGYGAIIISDLECIPLSGGYRLTTNNRMELFACIHALAHLEDRCNVTVYSDSQYLVNGISKGWALNWKRNNWLQSDRKRAKNIDLWDPLLSLVEKHRTQFVWVKAHNGHPENDRCDQLANATANGPNLLEDEGYTNR